MKKNKTNKRKMMQKYKIHIIIALLAVSTISQKLHADIFDTFGYGDRGISMGGAVCASVEANDSVYYNIAGLAKSHGNAFGFSYLYTEPTIKISNADSTTPDNKDLPTAMYVTDLTIDINKFFNLPRQVTFGLGMGVQDNLTLASLEDLEESRYQYIRYGAPIKRAAIYMGTGIEIIRDWLWIGVGAHAMVTGEAAVNLTLESDSLSTTEPIVPSEQDVWMKAKTKICPTAGIILSPLKDMNIGFSYKDDISVDFDPFVANMEIRIGTSLAARAQAYTAILAFYNPKTYRLGISYKLKALTVETDISYEKWSEFKRSVPREQRSLAPTFKDVYSYHVGSQINVFSIVNIWTGYQYSMTPVPDQPDNTNYLDSNRHILSCGLGLDFKDPIGFAVNPIHVGFGFQDQIITDRTFIKSNGNNVSMSGNAVSFILSVTLRSDFQKQEENLKENETDEMLLKTKSAKSNKEKNSKRGQENDK